MWLIGNYSQFQPSLTQTVQCFPDPRIGLGAVTKMHRIIRIIGFHDLFPFRLPSPGHGAAAQLFHTMAHHGLDLFLRIGGYVMCA